MIETPRSPPSPSGPRFSPNSRHCDSRLQVKRTNESAKRAIRCYWSVGSEKEPEPAAVEHGGTQLRPITEALVARAPVDSSTCSNNPLERQVLGTTSNTFVEQQLGPVASNSRWSSPRLLRVGRTSDVTATVSAFRSRPSVRADCGRTLPYPSAGRSARPFRSAYDRRGAVQGPRRALQLCGCPCTAIPLEPCLGDCHATTTRSATGSRHGQTVDIATYGCKSELHEDRHPVRPAREPARSSGSARPTPTPDRARRTQPRALPGRPRRASTADPHRSDRWDGRCIACSSDPPDPEGRSLQQGHPQRW